jgi:hypothetical protein
MVAISRRSFTSSRPPAGSARSALHQAATLRPTTMEKRIEAADRTRRQGRNEPDAPIQATKTLNSGRP